MKKDEEEDKEEARLSLVSAKVTFDFYCIILHSRPFEDKVYTVRGSSKQHARPED